MAAFFYDSTGSNTAPYDTWAKAATSLATVAAAMAAGDTLWVGDDSNENLASAITATFPGTAASPNFIYCVDHTIASPGTGNLKTGTAGAGSVRTTGANGITLNGTFYCYGVLFAAGTGAAAATLTVANSNTNMQVFENCALQQGGSAGGTVRSGATGAQIVVSLINTTVQFANASGGLSMTGKFFWRNTASAVTGTPPTTLFLNNVLTASLCGVDLSGMSGKTLFAAFTAPAAFVLQDCKLPASVTINAAQAAGYQFLEVFLIRCDSTSNYRQEKHTSFGDLTTETTIVRTGGATDGTTALAHKIITNANSKWIVPFESIPITFWNDSLAAMTVTVFGIWGGGAVPNNDDIWIDVEYLGSASSPQATFLSGTKANNLATGAAQTTDSSTWGGSTTAFAMVSASFTPAQKGPITVYVRAAKLSTTFYVDPRPVIAGVAISRSEILAPGIYANELAAGGPLVGGRLAL